MSTSDYLPWRRRSSATARSEFPLISLQDQMNRLFDGFFTGFSPSLFEGVQAEGTFVPKVNVAEDQKEIRVTAELPGLDEKDVELTIMNDALVLKGHKRSEHEEKKEGRTVYVERSYGSFQRVIPLSCEVNEDKIDASFKNGVLTVSLPKREPSSSGNKRISIRNG